MAYDTLIDSEQLNGALTATADAIRSVKDSSDPIEWNADTGFADALSDVSGGGDTTAEDGIISRTLTEYSNNRVTSIGDYAFQYYTNLISVDFSKVTSIGVHAFSGCSSLTNVDFPNATETNNYVFANCKKLINADFPYVTRLGSYAFQNCSNLTNVDFPSATTLGSNAFQNCSSLTSADFPYVTRIYSYAFSGCSSLTNVDFPSATSVDNDAFKNCTSLPSVDFPNATSIASNAFNGCGSLSTLILRTSARMCSLSNTNAFTGTPFASNGAGGIVLVPRDFIPAHQTATNWSTLYASGKCLFWAIEDYTLQGDNGGEIAWDYLNADREAAFA